MKAVTKISMIAITAFSLSACGNSVKQQQTQRVFTPIAIATPIKPIIQEPLVQELHITIQQDVTTKQEVFQVLGQPDQYASHAGLGVKQLQYSSYDNANRLIYITYIEKDGTELSYIMGSARNHKKGLYISLDKQDKVNGIQVY